MIQKVLILVLEKWADELLSYKPRYIGLSTHAWSSMFFLDKFAQYLKANHPQYTVIMGGPPSLEIGRTMLEEGKIDYYVGGDGEEALVNILQDKFDHPNINCKTPTGISNDEFNNLPIPDFSDANFDYIKKRFPDKNKMYLISSRGCVFNCSFCNVPYTTQNYRYKEGSVFANEVLTIQKMYEPAVIELADSLINGSMKIYRDFIESVLEIKKRENISFQF